MSIKRAKEAVAKIRRLSSPEMQRAVRQALYKGGQLIEVTAEHLITAGSASGRHHEPSRPGQPPNRDTGVLDGHIETDFVGPLKVAVTSNAPYAAELEFGTSKMEARPYLKPAVAMKRAEVRDYVQNVVNSQMRKLRG